VSYECVCMRILFVHIHSCAHVCVCVSKEVYVCAHTENFTRVCLSVFQKKYVYVRIERRVPGVWPRRRRREVGVRS